jgi:hypothetical protein
MGQMQIRINGNEFQVTYEEIGTFNPKYKAEFANYWECEYQIAVRPIKMDYLILLQRHDGSFVLKQRHSARVMTDHCQVEFINA